jgi:hypothetical protein
VARRAQPGGPRLDLDPRPFDEPRHRQITVVGWKKPLSPRRDQNSSAFGTMNGPNLLRSLSVGEARRSPKSVQSFSRRDREAMTKTLVAASVFIMGLAGVAFAMDGGAGAPHATPQFVTAAPPGHAVRYDGRHRYVYRDGCWFYRSRCYAYRHGHYVYRYKLGRRTGNAYAAPAYKPS